MGERREREQAVEKLIFNSLLGARITMGDLFTWFLHQGIVRVLSVPILIGLLIWLMWVLASPPPWHENDDAEAHRS